MAVLAHHQQEVLETGGADRDNHSAARRELESLLGRRVYLDLRVKLEPGWRENRRLLAGLDREVFASRRW